MTHKKADRVKRAETPRHGLGAKDGPTSRPKHADAPRGEIIALYSIVSRIGG